MRKLRALWDDMAPGKKRVVKPVMGVLVGGTLGFAYYWTIGCSTGACPITSNPWISTLWGAAIGGFATA
jgi:hypothetical protein